MRGQWLGSCHPDGGNGFPSELMINIDKVGKHFSVAAYVNPSTTDAPGSVSYFTFPEGRERLSANVNLFPIHPDTKLPTEWSVIKKHFPNTTHADVATIELDFKKDLLEFKVEADNGVKLTGKAENSVLPDSSHIAPNQISWQEFKRHVASVIDADFIFRGQREPWPLRTSFHRLERFLINSFIKQDVQQLHRHLSAITQHYFDLNVPEQNGAFLNLLQHHGYPTPLLDWTLSPYVAAFFAFKGVPADYSGDVRIYMLEQSKLTDVSEQSLFLDPAFPHISRWEFVALDNPRAVPQQAVTTVSNVADIEKFILNKSENILWAFDIPARERNEVMKELRQMGITAASMFPGIDGVCAHFKEQNF